MKAGFSKVDITVYNEGKGMMGYGMYFHKTMNIETPLFARCAVMEDEISRKKLVFVCAELCFPTIALKHEIIQRLKLNFTDIDEENFMFTAQHTHSSPAGLSHYLFYNIVTPGFQPNLFNEIAKRITEGIITAHQNLKKCSVKFAKDSFDEAIPVAFNRSMKAYNSNPEVFPKTNESHKSIDRNMRLMLFTDENNEIFGAINWFGVHTTSISNDKNAICSDNKGYAAAFHEKERQDFVSMFAQEAAGDVTPNYIWDKKKKWNRGIFENDYESAQWNGNEQKNKAEHIIQQLMHNSNANVLKGDKLDCIIQNFDFSETDVDKAFSHGNPSARTANPAIGVAMLAGTKEGPGMHPIIAQLTILMSKLIKLYENTLLRLFINERTKKRIIDKYRAQGKKNIVIEAGVGRLLGTSKIKDFIVPKWADPTIAYLKEIGQTRYGKVTPWIPKILPLQIFQICNVAIVSIPGEITTIAAQRLRKLIAEKLSSKEIDEIIIAPYANAYCGYITTFEEYQLQCYEGGHTVFGEHTLGAFLTHYSTVCNNFVHNNKNHQLQPKVFDIQDVWHYSA